jgi:vesicle coat complex subunit
VLEQQVQNKNNCIDYLRNDLEEFERKSSDLLRIVYALESKLENKSNPKHRDTRRMATPKWEGE